MVNVAFENRVREVLLLELAGETPDALRMRHGAVVLRVAAERKPLLTARAGRWCAGCGGWYVWYEGQVECPHCWMTPESHLCCRGSKYAAVTRQYHSSPRVHAMATEKWVRPESGFSRLAGQLLCRTDGRLAAGTMTETEEPVTCKLCLEKIRVHLGEVQHDRQ